MDAWTFLTNKLQHSRKGRVHLKRVALSILIGLCFLIIISDAKVTINSYNENASLMVAQVDAYSDDTILILLKSSISGSCGDSTLYFRIIAKDGTITKFNYNSNSTIPLNNFCFSNTTTSIPISPNGPGVVIPRSKTSLYSTINIYALSRPFILVTYYCNYPQSYQMFLIEMLYVLQFYLLKVLALFNLDLFRNTDGSIMIGMTGQSNEITKITDMTQFPKFINIFPIENDYGLVYTKYVSQSGQGITSPWQLYLTWISYTDSSTKGNALIYESQPSTNTTDYYLYQCSVAQESVGYNCLVYIKRTDKAVYVNINFLYSGSVDNVNEISINLPAPYTTVIDVDILSYGGYIFVAKDTTNAADVGSIKGLIYYNNGTQYGPWELSTIISDIPIIDITPNNTVWTITQGANTINNGSKIIKIVTNITNFIDLNMPFFLKKKVGLLGSAYVTYVTPETNSVITPSLQEITITYSVPVYKSTGSFKIWEVNTIGGADSLRGVIPASNDRVIINNENVTVVLLSCFTSNGHKRYYITVDDDAMQNMQNQNLIGIKKPVWNFITCDVSVIIRLTQQGTQFYLDSSSSDQSNFVKNMGSDIAKVINCDVSRITIPTHYQYSNENNTDDKIFM
ncbi:16462_t:CDS:2, partial [Racocetra fulgida]